MPSSSFTRAASPARASATGSGRWTQSASGPSGRLPPTRTGWPGVADHGGVGRHVVDDHGVGADLRPLAHVDRAEQLGARAHDHVVPDGGVALAALEAGAAQRHTLVERHVVADLGGLADHHSCAVVDEQRLPDLGGRVDLHAGGDPGRVGQQARRERECRRRAERGRPGGRAAPARRRRSGGSRRGRRRAPPGRARAPRSGPRAARARRA